VAMHAGPVVTGEVGDIKREITYLGDTVNTAARIAGECRQYQALVLASAASLSGAALPVGLSRIDLGPVKLRGRSEPVALALVRCP
jgi:adenylate cyclase